MIKFFLYIVVCLFSAISYGSSNVCASWTEMAKNADNSMYSIMLSGMLDDSAVRAGVRATKINTQMLQYNLATTNLINNGCPMVPLTYENRYEETLRLYIEKERSRIALLEEIAKLKKEKEKEDFLEGIDCHVAKMITVKFSTELQLWTNGNWPSKEKMDIYTGSLTYLLNMNPLFQQIEKFDVEKEATAKFYEQFALFPKIEASSKKKQMKDLRRNIDLSKQKEEEFCTTLKTGN